MQLEQEQQATWEVENEVQELLNEKQGMKTAHAQFKEVTTKELDLATLQLQEMSARLTERQEIEAILLNMQQEIKTFVQAQI